MVWVKVWKVSVNEPNLGHYSIHLNHVLYFYLSSRGRRETLKTKNCEVNFTKNSCGSVVFSTSLSPLDKEGNKKIL